MASVYFLCKIEMLTSEGLFPNNVRKKRVLEKAINREVHTTEQSWTENARKIPSCKVKVTR